MVTPGPPDVEPDATSDADDAVDVVSTDEAASADVATGEMAAPDLAADSAAPVEVDTAETSRPTGAEAALLPKSGRLLYVTLPGLWGALLASCLSFTPSLLPRTGTIQ